MKRTWAWFGRHADTIVLLGAALGALGFVLGAIH